MLPASNTKNEFKKLETEDDLKTLKKACTDKAILVLFWAEWDESSQALKSMMEEMPNVYNSVRFAYVDCDESDLVDTLDVDTVQTLVCLHPEGSEKKMDKYSGIKPEQLTEIVERENVFYKEWFEQEQKKVFRDIEGHISTYPFFAFIKGTKEEPKCKFTKRLVNELLGPKGYEYKTFNILADERIRQWIKLYTNWPTFPQLFINGKFVGGIDVVSELIEEDEFDAMVPDSCKPLSPKDQVQKILSENKVVVLINGSLDAPSDENSKLMIERVNSLKCEFTAIDYKSNAGYSEYFKQDQVIPYLFLKGIPACGVEGIDQLPDDEMFKSCFTQRKLTVTERIENLISKNKVILFMKGNPDDPQCGFSSKIIGIFKQYDGFKFEHFNIFEDQELREALKKYSNWPTYPQLYVNGKLIGGIDIVQELHDDNELEEVIM